MESSIYVSISFGTNIDVQFRPNTHNSIYEHIYVELLEKVGRFPSPDVLVVVVVGRNLKMRAYSRQTDRHIYRCQTPDIALVPGAPIEILATHGTFAYFDAANTRIQYS